MIFGGENQRMIQLNNSEMLLLRGKEGTLGIVKPEKTTNFSLIQRKRRYFWPSNLMTC